MSNRVKCLVLSTNFPIILCFVVYFIDNIIIFIFLLFPLIDKMVIFILFFTLVT